MDLIDEVDYHCCIFCDKIFPVEHELSLHVNEFHRDVEDLDKSMDKDNIMEYIQSAFVDEEESIQCEEYFETLNNNNSPLERVNLIII